MAELKNIEMQGGSLEIRLSISKEEYKVLEHNTTSLVALPSGNDSFPFSLTTGKLGNSNRVMLPKKILESFKINHLDKKVHANIYFIDGNAFLLIKIMRSELGIPKFEGLI